MLPDERETVLRLSFPWEATGGPGAGQEQAGAAFTLGIRNSILRDQCSTHRDRPYQAGRPKHWIKVKNRKQQAFDRVMGALGH